MLSRSEYKSSARSKLSGNFGVVIGMLLIVGVINIVFSTINESLEPGLVSSLIGIISAIISILFAYSFMYTYIKVVNGQALDFSDCISAGFKENPTRTILLGFIEGIFIILWTLLLIIPGFIKYYAYSMTFFLINHEAQLSPVDAITKSRSLMDGYKMELFILDLSFIGWYILSVFTLGLLLLYVVPYHQTTRVEYFMEIYGKHQNLVNPNTPKTEEDPLDTI